MDLQAKVNIWIESISLDRRCEIHKLARLVLFIIGRPSAKPTLWDGVFLTRHHLIEEILLKRFSYWPNVELN